MRAVSRCSVTCVWFALFSGVALVNSVGSVHSLGFYCRLLCVVDC